MASFSQTQETVSTFSGEGLFQETSQDIAVELAEEVGIGEEFKRRSSHAIAVGVVQVQLIVIFNFHGEKFRSPHQTSDVVGG
jgi:hypothetical protein